MKTKRRLELFAFWQPEEISRHLEGMAQKVGCCWKLTILSGYIGRFHLRKFPLILPILHPPPNMTLSCHQHRRNFGICAPMTAGN